MPREYHRSLVFVLCVGLKDIKLSLALHVLLYSKKEKLCSPRMFVLKLTLYLERKCMYNAIFFGYTQKTMLT